MIDTLLSELNGSLRQSRDACIHCFRQFIREYQKDARDRNARGISAKVFCLLEDMESLNVLPSLSTVHANGDVALDRVDLGAAGNEFFAGQEFMPDWYRRDGYDLLEEHSGSQLEDRVKTIVLTWFKEAWQQAAIFENVHLPLYFTRHFSNNVITNLETSEEIVLFQ